MDKTFKGILIAVVVIGLLFFIFKPQTPNVTVTPSPTPPVPPMPPNPNTVDRTIIVVDPATTNWNNLIVGQNYRWGNYWIRGYSSTSTCQQHISDSTGGTGILKGRTANSCWYLFLNQPSGSVVGKPFVNPINPHPTNPTTQMARGGEIVTPAIPGTIHPVVPQIVPQVIQVVPSTTCDSLRAKMNYIKDQLHQILSSEVNGRRICEDPSGHGGSNPLQPGCVPISSLSRPGC